MSRRVGGFNWDVGNIPKCQKHGVSVADIEILFGSASLPIEPDLPNSKFEERFNAIGRTSEERSLFLVFTFRILKGVTLIRPISARYMHRKEIEHYEKENPDSQE